MSHWHECLDEDCDHCMFAVKSAYEGMRLVGRDIHSAFRVATMVLKLRRPGRTTEEYEEIVANWLCRYTPRDDYAPNGGLTANV